MFFFVFPLFLFPLDGVEILLHVAQQLLGLTVLFWLYDLKSCPDNYSCLLLWPLQLCLFKVLLQRGLSLVCRFYCDPSLLDPLALHFLFCWTKDNFLLSPRRSLQYNLPSYWLILLPCQEVNFYLSFVTPGRLLLIPLRRKSYFFLRARKGLQKELRYFLMENSFLWYHMLPAVLYTDMKIKD